MVIVVMHKLDSRESPVAKFKNRAAAIIELNISFHRLKIGCKIFSGR
jgi:hypothetical protein